MEMEDIEAPEGERGQLDIRFCGFLLLAIGYIWMILNDIRMIFALYWVFVVVIRVYSDDIEGMF